MDDTQIDPNALTYPNNYGDVENYLSFLAGMTGEKEIFTFALMDERSESVVRGYGITHSKADTIIGSVECNPNATLHVCLNRTNMRGRKSTDMVSARVLCADLDTVRSKEEISTLVRTYAPGMVVESSPGKYHLYWKIGSEVPLVVWSELQLGLAELLGGDYALRQVAHTIRVPGIGRICKDGSRFLPRIVLAPEQPVEWSLEDIRNKLPDLPDFAAIAKEKLEADKKARQKVSRQIKTGKPVGKISGTGRNPMLLECLIDYCKENNGAVTIEGLKERALAVNEAFEKGPLGEKEVTDLCVKVLKRNAEFEEDARIEELEREAALGALLIRPVDVTQQPISQNGGYVNLAVENGNGLNGHTTYAPGEYPYDYSVPRLKNSRISDSGLVERVFQRFGSDLIRSGKVTYAFQSKSKLWVPQSTMLGTQVLRGMVLKCADDLCADPVLLELFRDKDGVDNAKVLREQQKWHSHRSINGAIGGVLNEEQVRIEPAAIFDAQVTHFYAVNGVVNLATGEMREAKASDHMLKRSLAVFNPEASYDWWVGFLQEVFANNPNRDEELVYLQEVFGYALTGCTEEQKIFIHTGEGSNGKSRVISALNALCGDYATRLSSNSLSKTKNAVLKEIERIGVKIEGKRAVIIEDLDSDTQWNDSFLKALTDDTMLARNLYSEEREIPNRVKIHICCNDIPKPEKANVALYRRLAILDYNRKFEVDAHKAREIKLKIQEHLSGILNWAIEGFQRVVAQGNKIKYPKSVECTLQVYKEATEDMSNSLEELTKVFSRELASRMNDLDREDLAYEGHWKLLDDLCEEFEISRYNLGKILSAQGFKKSKRRKPGKKGRPTCYFVEIE